MLGAVYDSNGKAVGSFRQRVEVTRTRENEPPVYTNVNHQVDLPPGLYQVRVIAAERGTNHLTGVMDWIEIPKVKEGTFSISSLFVGEISQAGGAAQVGVNASRRFARSSRLRLTTNIYNAATPVQLGLQIKILRGKQAVLTPAEIVVGRIRLVIRKQSLHVRVSPERPDSRQLRPRRSPSPTAREKPPPRNSSVLRCIDHGL